MSFSTYFEQRTLDETLGGVAATVNGAITAGQTAVTSITVNALATAIPANSTILVSWGTANIEAFTVTSAGAAAGATSIPVTSQTSSKAHAVSDAIVLQSIIALPATIFVGLVLGTTLTAGLTNGQTGITSLSVTGVPTGGLASGQQITLQNGASLQTVTTSAAAAAGATTISVTSFTANAAYPAGNASTVTPFPLNPGSTTLSTGLTSGQTAVTSLSVAAVPTGGILSGQTIQLGSGTTSQIVTASAAAAAGATTISVTSFTANAAYPANSAVTVLPYMVEPSGGAYSRVSLANNPTNWPASTGNTPATKSNGVAVAFPAATGIWGTITWAFITDQSTGGNIIGVGYLNTAQVVNNGDSLSFAVGQISITDN